VWVSCGVDPLFFGKNILDYLFIAIAILLSQNRDPSAGVVVNRGGYTAQEIFEKCKLRAEEIDSELNRNNLEFTQKIEFRSRGGEKDIVVFKITVEHGKFIRKLIYTTVSNGNRFNGGYDAFDKMFFLSEYFSDPGKIVTSCEFEKPDCDGCYGINFILSNSSDKDDPLNIVSASLTMSDFTPVHIVERVNGLPLGVEFYDDINVGYDKNLDMCYPENITMRVYAHLFFLKGEIAVVKIKNENLRKF
jgi:hypothetical protein